MVTKPSLQKDNIKEQEAFVPEGYIRPNVLADPDTQTNLEAHPGPDTQANPDRHTTSNADTSPHAATVVKSEKGGSTIVDFNYAKYADVERKAAHTNAVAGLTLGILSLVTVWFSGLLALVLSIVGIVLSLMGRTEPGGKSMAAGGLVCSIIGLSLSLLAIIFTLVFVVGFIDGVSSIWQW